MQKAFVKESKATEMFWRKTKLKQQHLRWTSAATGTEAYFPLVSYRQVGYWWKNDGWCVIFFPSPVWGTHYLLIHTRAASQFEENKHCGFWRQHHFYFMTAPCQLFPDWGKLSAAWHLLRWSTLLAPSHMYVSQYSGKNQCVKGHICFSMLSGSSNWSQSVNENIHFY